MNKNNILSGGGKNLTGEGRGVGGGGKWGERGREVGGEGEGSGVKGGGKRGLGTPCPPPQIYYIQNHISMGKYLKGCFHLISDYKAFIRSAYRSCFFSCAFAFE